MFLDEYNTADTMGAVQTLVVDRKIGRFSLHPNVAIVAACNPNRQRVGGEAWHDTRDAVYDVKYYAGQMPQTPHIAY